MLTGGILNPAIRSLFARVRHTNALVIADRGFPYWPTIETVDISLTDDVPTVLQVLDAIRADFVVGRAYMAEEFLAHNTRETRNAYVHAFDGIEVIHEPHEASFKPRVSHAIGLVRTGDTTQYGNVILVSA